MIPIAILASGRGSNFDAILRAVRTGSLAAEIVALVCDRPDAPVLEKARSAGIAPVLVAPEKSEGVPLDARRRIHDERVLDALKPHAPRFLVMAGYMRVVSPALLEAFRSERGYSRITNVHPSLLPAFPGVNSYAQAFEHGSQVTGVSVHLVEEQVDNGPICSQEAFSIASCRSSEEVEKKGLEVEHRLYPEALKWILPERFTVENRGPARRICVRAN